MNCVGSHLQVCLQKIQRVVIDNDAALAGTIPSGDYVLFLKIEIGANSVSASGIFLVGIAVQPMELPMEIEIETGPITDIAFANDQSVRICISVDHGSDRSRRKIVLQSDFSGQSKQVDQEYERREENDQSQSLAPKQND